MGWAIASIVIGVVILAFVGRIVGWMGAADAQPLSKYSRRLPAWLTPRRERRVRTIWVVLIALIFIALGVGALL